MDYAIQTPDALLGKKIKSRRKSLKMTQKGLAEKLGVTFQQVQKYESGQNRVSIAMLMNICGALKIRPHYFFEGLPLEEDFIDEDTKDMEEKLLNAFRSIESDQKKQRILKVVETLVETER